MQNPTTDHAILERLRTYRPGNMRERVCLQLFGMLGHGKSSLINTCVCVVQNEGFRNVAGSGQSNDVITMERRDFPLADRVVITDNRGISKMSNEELVEIKAQFCNLRGRDRVEWGRSFKENLDHVLTFLHQNNDVIVPVFVYSAPDSVTPERYPELEPFIRDIHRITGIYPIIVLTKVQDHRADPETCYKTFKEIGAEHIFQIENYTTETCERNPETKSRVLVFLETCLQEADRQISENWMANPQQAYLKNAMDIIEGKMQIELDHKRTEFERMCVAKDKVRQEETEWRDEEIERLREERKAMEGEIRKLRNRKFRKSCSVM